MSKVHDFARIVRSHDLHLNASGPVQAVPGAIGTLRNHALVSLGCDCAQTVGHDHAVARLAKQLGQLLLMHALDRYSPSASHASINRLGHRWPDPCPVCCDLRNDLLHLASQLGYERWLLVSQIRRFRDVVRQIEQMKHPQSRYRSGVRDCEVGVAPTA